MANEFDKILRDNFREPKQNLLRQLVPAGIVSIRPLVPKLQQTILERETDTIAEVQLKPEPSLSFILNGKAATTHKWPAGWLCTI